MKFPTGTETIAGLNPTRIVTGDSAMNRFGPEKRGCYVDAEFQFPNLKTDNGFRYSIKNCLYEAVIERFIYNKTGGEGGGEWGRVNIGPYEANFKRIVNKN
jgi:hypothetical protein